MKNIHPAMELFLKLFEKAAMNPGPEAPTHYVPRNVFHSECRKAGIDIPNGFIAASEWEERIGLPEFVHKIIRSHHKKHGTDFSPMEKGHWRLRKRMQRRNQPTPQPTGGKG